MVTITVQNGDKPQDPGPGSPCGDCELIPSQFRKLINAGQDVAILCLEACKREQ